MFLGRELLQNLQKIQIHLSISNRYNTLPIRMHVLFCSGNYNYSLTNNIQIKNNFCKKKRKYTLTIEYSII